MAVNASAGILHAMTDPPRQSKRAAREASEAAMLAAATRMLLQGPVTDVLAGLRPVEVARQSDPPRTTGAFYNIWPSQADFRRALLDHLLSPDRLQGDRTLTGPMDAAARGPAVDVHETVRVSTNLNFDRLKDDPGFRLQHALWTQAGTDPEVRERLRTFYATLSERLVPRYAVLLQRSGLRLRPPFTEETMAVAIAALMEGLCMRWAIDPGSIPDDLGAPPGAPSSPDQRWSMFGALVHVLVTGMTEPVPGTTEPVPGTTGPVPGTTGPAGGDASRGGEPIGR